MIHIIGAGLAGLFLGETIRSLDRTKTVVIYEEHGTVGEPVQCTGILTPEIHRIVKLPEEAIANRVSKARIHAPDGRHLDITFAEPDIILWRARFDQWLAMRATQAGCTILQCHKLARIEDSAVHFSISGRDKKVALKPGDIVVGCDGPRSTVARELGIYGQREQGFGIQATIEAKHDNAIEFYPFIGDYAWLCPEGKGRARVGVEAMSDFIPAFERFVKRFKGRIISRQAGFIPRFRPGIVKQAKRDGIPFFLVGDAAAQTKNTTGGGIIAAMKAARILGRLIAEGKEQRYTQAIKKEVTAKLYLHYLVHKRMAKYSDEDWNRLIARFDRPRLKRVLSRVHRDDITRLAGQLVLKDPRLFIHAIS